MEHVVFFPAHDGTPAFRRVANLEDAVRLVEHLRNVEGVAEVSVHALSEVPLSFKAYYRVEVPTDAADAAEAAPVAEVPVALDVPQEMAQEVVVPSVVEDIPEQPAVALAASNGQPVGGGGAKSLGFFAS